MIKSTKKKETMKKEIIKEEPILEISIKVDRTINGKYYDRLNWSSMNGISPEEIFSSALDGENPSSTDQFAKKRAMRFKARLKAYVIEYADKLELDFFDWSNWDKETD